MWKLYVNSGHCPSCLYFGYHILITVGPSSFHFSDVMMSTIASRLFAQPFVQAQIKENITIPASLAYVRGIHRSPVDSPRKGPVTRKCFHLMTSSCVTHHGMSSWWPLLGVCPSAIVPQSSHCNLFEDGAPLDICPIKRITCNGILCTTLQQIINQ